MFKTHTIEPMSFLKVICLTFFLIVGNRLNEYISHFETLSYDTKHLHAKHTRAKRAIGEEQHVHLKFTSHGEHFHLRLKRDLTTFSDNLEVHIKCFITFCDINL
jgi:hypothetical protein